MKRLLLLASLIVLAWPTSLRAEEGKTALRLTPVIDQLVVKPGQTTVTKVNLTNLSSLPLPIKGYARAFIATDEEGGSDYPDDPTPGAVQTWFHLDEPDFIIQPNQTKPIDVQIAVPAGTEPGGHYATLFFESLVPTEALSESSLYLSGRIGALFFFVVSGDIHTLGQFQEFKTAGFHTGGAIDFKLAFQNNGNVHVKPKSRIIIKNWFGRTVGGFDDDGQNVLPGKLRRWQVSWTKSWLFGRYTAQLQTQLTPDSKPVYKEVSFWVIPIWQFLVALLAIGLFYLLIIRARGRWKAVLQALLKK